MKRNRFLDATDDSEIDDELKPVAKYLNALGYKREKTDKTIKDDSCFLFF